MFVDNGYNHYWELRPRLSLLHALSEACPDLDPPVEIPPYRIPKLADISGTCIIHRCIGKKRPGLLADQCKAVLSHDIRPVTTSVSKSFSTSDSAWAETGTVVKLARLCLCRDCGQTQLSDVVVAWVQELENTNEPEIEKADSVVDDQEKKALVTDLAPVNTLIAASVATRDLFSKVYGFWS